MLTTVNKAFAVPTYENVIKRATFTIYWVHQSFIFKAMFQALGCCCSYSVDVWNKSGVQTRLCCFLVLVKPFNVTALLKNISCFWVGGNQEIWKVRYLTKAVTSIPSGQGRNLLPITMTFISLTLASTLTPLDDYKDKPNHLVERLRKLTQPFSIHMCFDLFPWVRLNF